ncbi:hypothetical protein J14TS5_18170 [Paenibacillus lautus]|uniref:hypothetical protein n=1 Tax=Paenibacillus lautus TaxID=1401 RepID=UPI001B1DC7F3|nr:hypothetical protein [Paenibacillus lautus]GIO96731.1 hypothetical protein J14TS5_18170 [Paenibacillus lautus]
MSLKKSRILLCFVFSISLQLCTDWHPLNQSGENAYAKISPNQAIRLLEEGNQRFVMGNLAEKHVIQARTQLVSE